MTPTGLILLWVAGCAADGIPRPANPTCTAPARPASAAGFELEQRFVGLSLSEAVGLTWSEGVPGWWYVIEKGGQVLRFADDEAVSATETVLDLGSQVIVGSETGLLGMAFHPDFAQNGEVYLNYTSAEDGLTTRISVFTSTDGGATLPLASERVIFEVDQPFVNHNAGGLAFGPDGFLYVGLGDGGSAGDPLNASQDRFNPLGKMLRFDVDGGSPYAIPADNPFADGVEGLPEIYAWGLRNPWRLSFDSLTGELWLGDVGQNDWEEVNRIERGGNYGWRVTEGKKCYDPPDDCDKAGLVPPVAVYPNDGSASVVGGIVYRGTEIAGLSGTYLYSDFYSGDIWAVVYDPLDGSPSGEVLLSLPGQSLVHWETGPDGEAWVLDYTGEIYRLVSTDPQTGTEPFPAQLSQTGCVDPNDPTQPAEGVLPYEVAHPLYSDGAEKTRWLAIPDGERIQVGPDGDWDLPVGSVLIKEFKVEDTRTETRLFVRHEDGDWAGYTYAWRADGSDADLLPAGLVVEVGSQQWAIPSRSDCMQCHTQAAGGSLGLEARQMVGNPELVQMGLVEGANPGWFSMGLPTVDGSASVEDRARAYLHVNCSQCHRPDGKSRTELDFRLGITDPTALGLCVPPEHGDLGVDQAQVVTPGDPERSLVWLRMTRRDANQMPPIGSDQVDEVGSEVIAEWIRGLSACE